MRATAVWKEILSADQRPPVDQARVEDLRRLIEKRTAAGGAPPEN